MLFLCDGEGGVFLCVIGVRLKLELNVSLDSFVNVVVVFILGVEGLNLLEWDDNLIGIWKVF